MNIITTLEMALKDVKKTKFLKLTLKDVVPSKIQDLIFLEELYLSGEFRNIPLDFSLFKNLKVISLNSPQLETFPDNILYAPNLLNLKIMKGSFHTLKLPLEILSPLKFLTIKEGLLESLPLEFGQLQSLVELNLSGNKLRELPISFKELTRLTRLNIDNNQFCVLSSLIKEIPSLRYLSCDGNPFSEDEKYRIQREFNISPH